MSASLLYPHVFQPLDIRGKGLRNRIVFGAHTANMAEGGLPAERHLGYYRARAEGGAGMIVSSSRAVLYAAGDTSFADAARRVATETRDALRAAVRRHATTR